MRLTCPYCHFTKAVATELLPHDVDTVTCPRCRQDFPLTREVPPAAAVSVTELPKAGFWLRLVAALIDMLCIIVLQLVLGAALGIMATMILGAEAVTTIDLYLAVELFTYVLCFTYFIAFTGCGGQTPGKMALRLKVIRSNGEDLSYGGAALRELPAKLIGALLLGIGYLMVAVDPNKQGLHDHMVKTYVIKL